MRTSSTPKTASMCWQNLNKLLKPANSMNGSASCVPMAKCGGSGYMDFRYETVPVRFSVLSGMAQEITAQKQAEDQVVRNLAKAESAWAEADALRKATLALTQDLRMDFVMDALLRSLAELVPYTCARVLVPEGGPHWLALGEKLCPEPADKSYSPPDSHR